MKSYTDLQQSKKLEEILPLESADMYYPNRIDIKYQGALPIEFKHGNPLLSQEIAAWSLGALFKLLPKSARLEKGNVTELCRVVLPVELEASDWCVEPIDACYKMIIRLNEL